MRRVFVLHLQISTVRHDVSQRCFNTTGRIGMMHFCLNSFQREPSQRLSGQPSARQAAGRGPDRRQMIPMLRNLPVCWLRCPKPRVLASVRSGVSAFWRQCVLASVRSGVSAFWRQGVLGSVRSGVSAFWGQCVMGSVSNGVSE